MDESRLLEKNPKMLAVSVSGGYQYADVLAMGPSVVVVTDNDPVLAAREAQRVADMQSVTRRVREHVLHEQLVLGDGGSVRRRQRPVDALDGRGGHLEARPLVRLALAGCHFGDVSNELLHRPAPQRRGCRPL